MPPRISKISLDCLWSEIDNDLFPIKQFTEIGQFKAFLSLLGTPITKQMKDMTKHDDIYVFRFSKMNQRPAGSIAALFKTDIGIPPGPFNCFLANILRKDAEKLLLDYNFSSSSQKEESDKDYPPLSSQNPNGKNSRN